VGVNVSAANPVELLQRGFEDAVVVVVGGRGDIGSAVVAQSASLGARVVAASRRPVDPGRSACPGSGEVAEAQVDVTDLASVERFAALLGRWFGRIDVLVNAAGTTQSVPAAEPSLLTDDILEEVFESNAVAPVRLVRETVPLLRAGRDPVVVHVSSVAARTGQGSNTAYTGAKAAVDAMVIAWAKALAPIRFVNVAPSALANDFVPGRDPSFLERTVAATPLGRLATAAEIGSAILVAARCLTMTTGVTIAADGGRHL
jgi:NAD(P)-dependent dehydrogenase (short-subunit alcohol dehydrogenase family)